ncbi:MAG: DsbC family protein [Pseudomonadota bacterium]|jgi:thiol:disulfide interchange protein DsbC
MKIKAVVGGLAALFIAQAALANEAAVRKAVEPVLTELFGPGIKADAVRKLGNFNLYEIQIGGDLLYTDEKVSYLINGDVLDIKAKKNLTEERKNKLAQVKFSDLPLELAAKQVKGNGKRILATFEDPNCTYCKKLAEELQKITDVTIYTFIYPIFPQSGDVAKGIWCAPDRAKAWNDYVLRSVTPPAAKCDTSGIDKVVALGRKLNIKGTPAMIFADGSRVPGYMPAAMLEKTLDKGSAN